MSMVMPAAVRPTPATQQLVLNGVNPCPAFTIGLNHKWVWVYDQKAKTGRWIPDIVKITHRHGVNGNRPVKQGKNYVDGPGTENIAHHQFKLKCTIVHPHDPRLGEFEDYLGEVMVRGRQGAGFWHGLRWTGWQSSENGRRWRTVPDLETTYRFREHLGRLYNLTIDESFLSDLRKLRNHRINRINDKINSGDLSKANAAEVLQDIYDELDAAEVAFRAVGNDDTAEVVPTPAAPAAKSSSRAARARAKAGES